MTDQPLAVLAELTRRLDWVLDADETHIAEAALEDLSNEARHFGSTSWTTINLTPPYVRTLVLKAAARYMKNYEGYVQSRAGGEFLVWAEIREILGTASFTRDEIERLEDIRKPKGLLTANTYAYSNSVARTVYHNRVPVLGGGRGFPFLTPEEEAKYR